MVVQFMRLHDLALELCKISREQLCWKLEEVEFDTNSNRIDKLVTENKSKKAKLSSFFHVLLCGLTPDGTA